MSTPHHTLRRILAIGVAAIATAALVASPAAAHTELRGSSPEEGSTVETLDEVRLDFSSALLDIGAELVLVDSDGTSHELTPEFPAGENAAVAAVASDALAAGETVLDWRIVAEDGHPIEGQIAFTYAPVEPAAPEDDPAAEDAPGQEPEAIEGTNDVEESAPIEPTAEMTPISEEPINEELEDEDGIAVWAWVLMGLAAGGLVVMAIGMSRKRDDT